jgi:15-cis-phytoene synthase
MNAALPQERLAAASEVLAQKGRSFHWARRLLGQTHAARATRLYAFCRHLDDLADEASSLLEARVALDHARQAVLTGESTDPLLQDGLVLIRECGIETETVLDLIAGVSSDLDPVRVADEAELYKYCYRVAGTVGLMMCRVLDVKDPAALMHAADLGIAMQLTNICRDIAEDATAGRRYLPATLCGEVGPAALISPAESLRPQVCNAVATLLRQAEIFYQSGERGLPYLPLRARCSILVAARVYRAIGQQLSRRGGCYWQGRVVVSDWEKARRSLGLLVTLPLRWSFWLRPKYPQPVLDPHPSGLPPW